MSHFHACVISPMRLLHYIEASFLCTRCYVFLDKDGVGPAFRNLPS